MQLFSETHPPKSGADVIEIDHSPRYIEYLLESGAKDGNWFAVYLVLIDDSVIAVMTCWGQRFDQIFAMLNDPKYGEIWADGFRKIWPTFFSLVDNTIDERWGDGALAQFVDPDDVNRKWFIVCLLPVPKKSTKASRQMFGETVTKVYSMSLQVAMDLQREMSWGEKARLGLRGGMVGYRSSAKALEPFTKGLEILQKILGG